MLASAEEAAKEQCVVAVTVSPAQDSGQTPPPLQDSGQTPPPLGRLGAALLACLLYPYFWACVVYLGYTCMQLAIDYCSNDIGPASYQLAPDYSQAPAPAPAPQAEVYRWKTSSICSEQGYSSINKYQYPALNSVHLINAVMYAAAWIPWLRVNAKSKSTLFLALIAFPEILNVVEAALYLTSARHYAHASATLTTYASSNEYRLMHRLELAASLIETVASFGWAWSWWATHERGPGRGLSIYDLDAWSTALLIAASSVYLAYNCQITRAQGEGWWGVHHDPNNYAHNALYVSADVMYFVGACLYLFASMRDCDCWFWLPRFAVTEASKPQPNADSPPVSDVQLTQSDVVASSV